jgi:hypothetical protein
MAHKLVDADLAVRAFFTISLFGGELYLTDLQAYPQLHDRASKAT